MGCRYILTRYGRLRTEKLGPARAPINLLPTLSQPVDINALLQQRFENAASCLGAMLHDRDEEGGKCTSPLQHHVVAIKYHMKTDMHIHRLELHTYPPIGRTSSVTFT